MPSRARFEVLLTLDAEADVEEITDYIEANDSTDRAELVFDRLKTSILRLESSAERGRVVPELRAMGVLEYREIPARPYRIIYFVSHQHIYVVAVIDGRRDLEDALARRLLR